MTLSLLPLILLTITLISLLVSQRTNHELTKILTGTLTIVGLIWGLAIAHWSITLLILFLISSQKNLLGLVKVETININE